MYKNNLHIINLCVYLHQQNKHIGIFNIFSNIVKSGKLEYLK